MLLKAFPRGSACSQPRHPSSQLWQGSESWQAARCSFKWTLSLLCSSFVMATSKFCFWWVFLHTSGRTCNMQKAGKCATLNSQMKRAEFDFFHLLETDSLWHHGWNTFHKIVQLFLNSRDQRWTARRKCLGRAAHSFFYFLLFIYLFIFGHPTAYGALGPGIRCELQPQAKPQLQQHQIDPQATVLDQGLNSRPSALKMLSSPLHSSNSTYFLVFRAAPVVCGSSWARGWIRAAAASLYHSPSNAGSLIHWARLGIKPASSWMLVGLETYWATMGTLGRKFRIRILILGPISGYSEWGDEVCHCSDRNPVDVNGIQRQNQLSTHFLSH